MRQIKVSASFTYTDDMIREIYENEDLTDEQILAYAKELMAEDLSEQSMFDAQFLAARFTEQP